MNVVCLLTFPWDVLLNLKLVLTARTMAKVMHQFMVKSSVSVFRVRLVVPLYDWPSILERDNNQYDSVSSTIDDNSARTRFGAGVLVMELGGPRCTDRMLCVSAQSSNKFIDVLYRLLSGLMNNRQRVNARMLIDPVDFEIASTINGRESVSDMLYYLQVTAGVHVFANFEHFNNYPLIDETAIRISGWPASVVKCICLINNFLGETLTTAVSQLVYIDRQSVPPVDQLAGIWNWIHQSLS